MTRVHRVLLALLAASLGALAAAVPALAGDPDVNRRPLVIAIVIDGLDGDSVDEGKAPFISSLVAGEDARATYFEESRAVMPTVTNANHVAMTTGAYANESGNPGNAFAIYAPLEDDDSCVATAPLNFQALPTETTGESRSCPQAEMVFEAIKRQGNPDELVTSAIFGKPVLGRIFAGRNVDPSQPDVDYLWAPCDEDPEDDEYCASVPTNPITGYAIDDATVMDEVIRTMREGVPVGGETKRPDFTFVNLPQVDQAGHGFGPGPVYDQAVALADEEIGRLVETLRELGEWERTVMVVLSDHAMDTTPTKVNLTNVLEDAGLPEDQFLAVMGDNGMAAHVYLADRRSPDRFAVARRIRETLVAHPSVADALYREPNPSDGGTAHTVEGARPAWNVAGERSGDVFVTAKPGFLFAGTTDSGNAARGHHGSNSTRDNFLAVIGGDALVRQRRLEGVRAPDFDDTAENPHQAENVDVAPTVMGLFGLFAPQDNAGRFLNQAFDRKVLREISLPARPDLRIRDRKGPRLSLSPRPKGGPYELEMKKRGKRWKTLLDGEAASMVGVRGEKGQRAKFRLRSISAANVRSRWAKERARF